MAHVRTFRRAIHFQRHSAKSGRSHGETLTTQILMHLDDLYMTRGQNADAINDYEKAMELQPDDDDVRRKLTEAMADAIH